jgi:serine/threonine protein kinase
MHFNVGEFVCTDELLGRGSFARVLRGYHRSDGRVVAIKEIDVRRLNATNPLLKRHLEEEIRIMQRLSTLSHPSVVKLYDVRSNSDKSLIYMVIEFCNSGDLKTYLDMRGPARRLTEAHAREIFVQFAAGLRFLRENRITHRDLKPQNLLLISREPEDQSVPVSLKIAVRIARESR